jgi:hypothetical protein
MPGPAVKRAGDREVIACGAMNAPGTRRPIRIAACSLAALALIAAGPATGPDMVDLVLSWSRGGFRSPLVCAFPDGTHQGLRRVVIAPGPPQSERRVNRLTFFDLDAPTAQHCSDGLGDDEPNIVGGLLLGYTAKRPRSDTPQRDFDQELKGGHLDFEIVAGRLRVGPVATPVTDLAEHDFSGGTARIAVIDPSSDEARMLLELGPHRRLKLSLAARDGTQLELPLVELERR